MAKRNRSQIAQRKTYRLRIHLVSLTFFCLFVVVLTRLYILQVVEHKTLVDVAKDQIYREVVIPAHRGDVRDRNGVILATSVFRETLYLDPSRFGEQEFEITRAIANALKQPRPELARRVSRGVTPVARRLSPVESQAVLDQARKIEPKPAYGAVFSRQESARLYPKSSLAANLVGFCVQEEDGSDDKGIAGLERLYDEWLRGADQRQKVLVNRWGQAIAPLDEATVLASYGNSIELTIDTKIQYFAETALADQVEATGGTGGACVVIDPRTGDLLAVASYPTFVPDDPRTRLPDYVRNRAFEEAVEPGSVMKIFTYATAAELNLFSPTEMIELEGQSHRFTEGRVGRTIVDFHDMSGKPLPFEEFFFESSNVAAVKLGLRIDDIDFYDYLSRLRLTERTELEFPGEATGHLTNLPWSFMTRTSVPFGYEVSANSVQMAAAVAAIANGGVKMAPRLVRRLIDSRGQTVEEFPPREQARVFSTATCQLMADLMEGTVEEGTGRPAAVPGYRVAGKTGTTRKTGRPDDDRAYRASFAGFLPVSDPQLAIYCWIDEPQRDSDAYTGGRAAAPVFQAVAAEAVRLLGILPDAAAEQPMVAGTLPPAPAEPVAALPTMAGLENASDAVALGAMPNLVGMTKREVTQALNALQNQMPRLDLRPRFYGNGIVLRQDPPALAPLAPVQECSIHFGRPGDLEAARAAWQGNMAVGEGG